MSARPTIEERLRGLPYREAVTDDGKQCFEVQMEEVVRHAKEYAAERTEPLVEALEGVDWSEAMTYEGGLDAHVYLSVDALNAIRAALAAEKEARQ